MLLPPKNKSSDCEHDNNRTKLEKNNLKQRKGKKKFINQFKFNILLVIDFLNVRMKLFHFILKELITILINFEGQLFYSSKLFLTGKYLCYEKINKTNSNSDLGFNSQVNSQKAFIELSFTAIYNSQSIPLDSIYIENLTMGGDTVLHGEETILVLNYLGNDYFEGKGEPGFKISQNYPNPIINGEINNFLLHAKQRSY